MLLFLIMSYENSSQWSLFLGTISQGTWGVSFSSTYRLFSNFSPIKILLFLNISNNLLSFRSIRMIFSLNFYFQISMILIAIIQRKDIKQILCFKYIIFVIDKRYILTPMITFPNTTR